MLIKTRGIVLGYIKHRETSIIVRIYTEQLGIQSYIVNGVRSSKSKKGLGLLQPLTLLDIVAYYKNNKTDGLHRISEYKAIHNFKTIPFDIKKSSIAIFITELITKVLQYEEQEGSIFEMLYDYIITLDEKESNYESYHLYLMVQLTHYLGFGIQNSDDDELHYQKDNTVHFDEIYLITKKLNECTLNNIVHLDNNKRKQTLDYLLQYYNHHVDGFNNLKSVDILKQIFQHN